MPMELLILRNGLCTIFTKELYIACSLAQKRSYAKVKLTSQRLYDVILNDSNLS